MHGGVTETAPFHWDGTLSGIDTLMTDRTGDMLAVGNYHGFNLYRLGAGGVPNLVSSVICPGGQGESAVGPASPRTRVGPLISRIRRSNLPATKCISLFARHPSRRGATTDTARQRESGCK